MKRKTLTLVFTGLITLILTTLTMNAFLRKDKSQATDEQGHVLTGLWADWNKAVQQDRPKLQEEILAQIRDRAMDQRLAWDFYDASTRYVDAVTDRNWKLADSLAAEFADNVRKFDEPVVTFTWMGRRGGDSPLAILKYVQDHAKSLKSSRNDAFYRVGLSRYGGLGATLAPFLPEFYANDYEYALWQLLPFTSYPNVNEGEIYAALKDYERDSYPLGVYLEYLEASLNSLARDAKLAELQKFADKYEGKAVSMYAKADILDFRFDEMEKSCAESADYEAFYKECQDFEKARKAFNGDEAKIVGGLNSVDDIVRNLTDKNIELRVEDGKIIAVLKNLKSVHLSMALSSVKSAGAVIDKTLKNERCSFYVPDTLTLDLPQINDGEYEIKAVSGKVEECITFQSRRISFAARTENRGICVYAADYESGEPIRKADIELRKSGKTVSVYKDLNFNGFTPLPAEIAKQMDVPSRYTLVCRFTDENGYLHESCDVSIWGNSRVDDGTASEKKTQCCNIYIDRGAYNPGDTVDFKAVIYKTDYVNFAETAPAGEKYNVSLFNAEGKKIDSRTIATNDFGSIAGQFALPSDGRNGWYQITVIAESDKLGGAFTKSFRVDEFVLPTFDVAFDKTAKLYFPGDEIVAAGKITSFTGHAVSSDNAVYEVTSYDKLIASGTLEIAADGTFSVKFRADDKFNWYHYNVAVKITDATGETHEYNKSLWVTGGLEVNAELTNESNGRVRSVDEREGRFYVDAPSILMSDVAAVKLSVESREGEPVPVRIAYVLSNEAGKVVVESSAQSGTLENIDMKNLRSGLYELKASAAVNSGSGREYSDTTTLKILLLRDTDSVLDAPVKDVIVPVKDEVNTGEHAELLFGTADGAPVWALAEVFGMNAKLLETKLVTLSGKRGESGSMARLSFDYKDTYPDAISVQMFYFKKSAMVSENYEFHRKRDLFSLPLEFATFEDKACPASAYTFNIKTLPGVECLAAVFDKSTEIIAPNVWDVFRRNELHVAPVSVSAVPGFVRGDYFVGYGRRSDKRFSYTMATRSVAMDCLEESEVVCNESAAIADAGADISVPIRERFANVLAFKPFLRSDKDGNISFSFSTSDKLSTYVVSLYAHDRKMHNAALRREMMVTIPLKVNVVESSCLYYGDKYRLAASVSSVVEHNVSGTLTLSVYAGKDYKALEAAGVKPLSVMKRKVTVPGGETVKSMFDVNVAELLAGAALPADLGFKLVFKADETAGVKYSDGMFVNVPVYPAVQALTESHSAVLHAGMDKDSLTAQLRGMFVNVAGDDAEAKVISIIDMIRDAIPSKVDPAGKDVLSLSEAMYVRGVAAQLRALSRMPSDVEAEMPDSELFAKVFACHNADGGFAWFEGMKSSPVITATLLERFSKMISAGYLDASAPVSADAASCADVDAVLRSAVRYLDKSHFSTPALCPLWCGAVSDEQYMYVRSMFAYVPFEVNQLTGTFACKRLDVFRKDAKEYLVPKKVRGMNGYILGKARRIMTLRALAASEEGCRLAKSWGLGCFNIDKKLTKSLEVDVVSLMEYAVEHKDGGMYYPNAVMPFRGLLESEAYAHSMLCDLLADYAPHIADGIRLWLMLQKETQHWDAEPAFVDAVNSVMNGSSEIKSTSVVMLTKTYNKPFAEIAASGNGFTLQRRFFRESASDSGKVEKMELAEGEMLDVGDKVIAEYRIHNDENRSFIRLTVPREAAFRPVDQLSGYYGWRMAPLRVNDWYSVAPQGYRNVKADRTEYMFDSYPEENTVISEAFFVTQAGEFTAPVPVIESLYAPHYRANDAFRGTVKVK